MINCSHGYPICFRYNLSCRQDKKKRAAQRAALFFYVRQKNYFLRLVFLSIPELGKPLYFFLLLPTGEPMRIIAQRKPKFD